jgi:hypothetical protein
MIKTSFEAVGAGLEMASSEHATASLRPVLEVTYGEPQVLNAKVYIDEPSIPLTLLGEEWRVVGGIQERWVDDDSIVTTEAVSCTTSATGLCREYRQRSRHSAVTPTDADSFTRYRGTSVEDPRVPRGAGELLSWADDVAGESPDGSGPIGSVKFSWQTLPPGAGTTYTLYESDSGFHEEPGTGVDGPNGEVDTPVIKEFRERLVIDTTTRLPIRWTAFERASGELVSRRIYSYTAALQPRSAFPADFFTVARPATPDSEKIVEFSDAPPSAARLAPATKLGAGSLCFDDAISARLTEQPLRSEVPKPDGSHLRAVQYSGVYANYQLRDATGRCGAGPPDVVVRSSPATGALGRAWKQSYIELGDPMQLRRPMSAARSLQPAAVDGGETVWLLPLRSGDHGFYAEEGDTALVVTGPVTARDVPAVLEGLEVR